MTERRLRAVLDRTLDANPAVALTGPRQVGKTTLAREIAQDRGATLVDLERPSDLARIADIERFCAANAERLIILDEVHRVPDLFAPLRSIIDEHRFAGRRTGLFLLLGSASTELLQQSETLAGRIVYRELQPLDVLEVPDETTQTLWNRGGFPDSYLATDDMQSLDWRGDFIRTYLERDIPALGPRIPAETLRRFWTMLAHNQGQTFNAAALARGLDVTGVTIGRYLDLMVDLLLVRRLQPWVSNLGRRLVKAPKTYIRDSGICHALLGIADLNELLGHPVVGGSWEGFAIENILGAAPDATASGHYRTAAGAEVDLVLEHGSERWAIEIKSSTAPKVSRGFHSACEDLAPTRRFVVHAGQDRFPLPGDVEAISLRGVTAAVSSI
ncbi:MAG: ATP-binding protein [Gammaproteobacteria bacterium]|nr:ATP-binding protein [Gammaproteobacteria bacterium]